eukprot:6198476-Pleurochrysis_carterae.AAC.2
MVDVSPEHPMCLKPPPLTRCFVCTRQHDEQHLSECACGGGCAPARGCAAARARAGGARHSHHPGGVLGGSDVKSCPPGVKYIGATLDAARMWSGIGPRHA